ncbi:TPA: hypothetical protein ACKRZV_001125 [Proteus mirabilis]|nr:hypothetical protein [Proteus mirabilis]
MEVRLIINWPPVYEDDPLTFSWLPPSTAVSDYEVNLELWDGNQKTNQIFSYNQNQLLGGQKMTTSFKINKSLFQSTQLKIKVIVFDIHDYNPNTNTGRQYAVYYPLDIKPINPMYMDLELNGSISFITTRDASISRNLCRTTQLDDVAHVIARPMFTLGSKSANFLAPVTVSHKLIDIQGASTRSSVDYNDKDTYTSRVENQRFQSNSASMAMKEDCWASGSSSAHQGNATLITVVTIASKTYEFKQHVNWDGDGAPSQNNITKISQL